MFYIPDIYARRYDLGILERRNKPNHRRRVVRGSGNHWFWVALVGAIIVALSLYVP